MEAGVGSSSVSTDPPAIDTSTASVSHPAELATIVGTSDGTPPQSETTIVPASSSIDVQSQHRGLDIILARYAEDLTDFFDLLITLWPIWTTQHNLPVRVFIYNKGPTDPLQGYETKKTFIHSSTMFKKFFREQIRVSSLDNVGREGHTFLHHIISQYHNGFAELNAFLPASCMSIHKVSDTKRLLEKLVKTHNSVFRGQWYEKPIQQSLSSFQIDAWQGTTTSNKEQLPSMHCLSAKIRPFGKWFTSVFTDKPNVHVVCYTSVFAVHRDHIVHNSIEHYQRVLDEVNQHSNPEAGHFLERSWLAVFHPVPEACQFAAKPQPAAVPQPAPSMAKKTFAQMKEELRLKQAAKQAANSAAVITTTAASSEVGKRSLSSVEEADTAGDNADSAKKAKIDSSSVV